MLSKLKKLRGRSLDELRVRGQQSLAAFGERRGWSSKAKLPTDREFANLLITSLTNASSIREHFHTSSLPLFFAGMSNRKQTIETLTERWPESCATIINRADQITAGTFDLLGYQGLSFGEPIDWHFEPVSGKRTPLVHWSQVDELDASSYGDQKILRELSRHQHFITLGQAYWLTEDERYSETFGSHLSSWMNQNPPKLGTNWSSSLEIAFRSISWLWSFQYFRDSPALSEEVFNSALKFLYLNALHLENYLSTYFSPNTHLTGEALGLFYLGTLLSGFKEANRWKMTGKAILIEQLPLHIRPDGVYFEQSSYYQRYTADFYLHFVILLQRGKQHVPPDVLRHLCLLLDHLMYISRPDGKTPLIGDDDGGRLMPLHPRPANDFRATLSTGAAVFKRSDYKFVSEGLEQEVLWLLGSEALGELDHLEIAEPAQTSVAFKQGGYYVMRDGWFNDSNYFLVDCGPHGILNAGHAHADALSFELSANGHPQLVDAGTFTYTGCKALRQWFRSSFAHNTLSLDQQSSAEPGGPFSWVTTANCTTLSWISKSRFDYFDGEHDGYRRLTDPVTHRRSVLFLKKDYWILRDQVISQCLHQAEIWFHFDANLVPAMESFDDRAPFIRVGNELEGALEIHSFGTGTWKQENAWVSDCYGMKQQSAALAFSTTIGGGQDIISFLMPGVAAGECMINQIEALGGRAFRISRKSRVDILMILDEGHVKTEQLVSDFQLTWARFDESDTQCPVETVAINGSSIECGGNKIVNLDSPANFVTTERKHNGWYVEHNQS